MNARFCHLISLKSQICNYFGPERRKNVDTDLSGWLRSTYQGYLAEATTSGGDRSVHRLRRLLELGELYSWLPTCQDEAVDILEESLQLANELPSPETLELKLTAYQALADEYKRRAKYEEAIALLEALVTFATADRKFFALDSLGWVSSRLGRLEAARAYLEEALEIARNDHGSNSPLTLRSKVTLAEVLSKLGRHEEAEELCAALEAQVKSHRQHGVPLPKDSISQLNTLASVYGQQGKYAEAVELYKLIVKDRKDAFGASHRLSLWAEMQLGLMMHKSGDVKSATELLLDLQPRQIEVLGPEHPDVRQVGALV
jgi:pentatricopeptide repeat protein